MNAGSRLIEPAFVIGERLILNYLLMLTSRDQVSGL